MTERNGQLLEIAKQYIEKNFPDSIKVLELEPLISETKNYWEVTYLLPEDTAGGVPVIHISKKNLEVIKAIRYQ